MWRRLVVFLGWGIALAFVQRLVEQTPPVLWLTERLAGALGYGLGGLVSLPIRVDGTVVRFQGAVQEVTPNCFGLAAVTFLLAAMLATPAGWRERLLGVRLGLIAIVLANVARLVMLSWFFAYAFSAFGFVHIPIWGTLVPLFLVGVWGLWLARDLHLIPVFPWARFWLAVLTLVPLVLLWYALLDRYVVALVVTVNALLNGLVGMPIESLRLTVADLLRHLDVAVGGGTFRVEVAAQTLNVIPFLALTVVSPLAPGRRALVAACGVAALAGLHVAGSATTMLLAWGAPRGVPWFEVVNDFFSLAWGPSLWFLLARPSPAWFTRPSPPAARVVPGRGRPAEPPSGSRRPGARRA